MISKNFALGAAALVFVSAFAVNANAASYVFNFTGECDDCAFNGNPSDAGFDPLEDGLTESVTATLMLPDVSISSDGLLQYLGGSNSPSFTYHGSSLINPFTISEPSGFSLALLPSGQVQPGNVFTFGSSQNYTNSSNPLDFSFPNFCTSVGVAVLGSENCNDLGLVSFSLASDGSWSIFGEEAFDVGGAGQFSSVGAVPLPAAAWLFGSGMLGLMGLVRRRKSV